MKKYLLSLWLLTLAIVASAANVNWKTSSTSLGEDLYRVDVTASIADGYHIYDFGPYENLNPTVVIFIIPEGAEQIGEISVSKEAMLLSMKDAGKDVYGWEGEVVFSATVRVPDGRVRVEVFVEWMSCQDGGQCDSLDDKTLKIGVGSPSAAVSAPESKESTSENGGDSIWSMILAAILWGFAALLTPCVFPMVPMTVSFFIKGSDNKAAGRFKALMYGVFIVVLYTVPIAIIILLTKFLGGDTVTADIFNWLATHWLPNIIFFIVFMVFAASFFGAFEIVLPSKLMNSSDEQASKRKGLGGVFFLALSLVLVSFSCTGPIVGTVLIKATSGEFWAPIVSMFAFATAFALPFVLFALFPSVLKKMPKSGGWLNSVKVVLGFVEIALGMKFLSTADQVYHWGILDREVYLAIWIAVFSLLGLYLLGKLKFKYDSPVKYISAGRLALAIGVFAFVVYMIPGMWGAPLKALSGYLPPIQTQDFVIDRYSPTRAAETPTAPTISAEDAISYSENAELALPGQGRYSEFLKMPLGLQGYFTLDEALEYAKVSGKPVFLDFTGHGCVNCREMEARVWSDPTVLSILNNDYVVCELYTDDKATVEEKYWVVTESGKTLKTIGKINSHFALTEYNCSAQPYYVLLSPEGAQLVEPRAYDLDAAAFASWLRRGLEAL